MRSSVETSSIKYKLKNFRRRKSPSTKKLKFSKKWWRGIVKDWLKCSSRNLWLRFARMGSKVLLLISAKMTPKMMNILRILQCQKNESLRTGIESILHEDEDNLEICQRCMWVQHNPHRKISIILNSILQIMRLMLDPTGIVCLSCPPSRLQCEDRL